MDTDTKTKQEIDFCYIFKHCYQKVFEIPHFYDLHKWNVGETYKIRVGHIYDPSKFWIVVKEKELNVFQSFLLDFYKRNGESYRMSIHTVCRHMYCVAFIDGQYYRALITNVPHNWSIEERAIVFLFDFGYICTVSIQNLYYLYEKMYEIPQFAVRASLSLVRPYDKPIWTYNVVKRFHELVSGKVLLCILKCTNPMQRIVDITIGDVNEFSVVTDIGEVLIQEKLAVSVTTKKESTEFSKKCRYVHKTKYPFLFPPFEAIEGGLVPSNVFVSELLTQCVSSDYLFTPYFAYNGTKDLDKL